MTKKQRKAPREPRLIMPRYEDAEEKTVRMRIGEWTLQDRGFTWQWRAFIGNWWVEMCGAYRNQGSARRSGKAWAKRMGLTPKWED